MYKLTFTLLCVLGIQLSGSAQKSISATSTAEECIAFIENTANGRMSDTNYTYQFSFNGTTFTEISKTKEEDIHISKIKYIDWVHFTEFETFNSKDELILVSFNFNTTLPNHRTFLTKGDGVTGRQVDYSEYFMLSLPAAQQGKIPELKIAANRLAQLAKSKSSPLLQVNIPPEALKQLPTESQTEDFILAKMSAFKRSVYNEDFKIEYSEFKLNTLWYEKNMLPAEETMLEYKDLKGINIIGNDIIFTGKTTIRNLRTYVTSTGNDIKYGIREDMPQSEKDRLLKALKHYVWMKGVDLVNDDLFDE